MEFRKFKADQIFTGTEFLNGEHVLITNNSGTVLEILQQDEAGDDVQQLKGILSPGFINCHCHLELSHMKSLIPEKTGLIDFVFKVVTQRHFPHEEIADAIEKAELEMIENGIVAVGDVCNNVSTLEQKIKGNLHYYNFVESSGWLPDIAQERFRSSKASYEKFLVGKENTSLVPHAPYSVSDNLWSLIEPFFRGKVVSIHNQETSFEDELFLQGSGDFIRMYEMMEINNAFFSPSNKSSLQTYFSRLENATSVILVHNTFTGVEDIAYAKETAKTQNQLLSFCLCVNANLYIENMLPPIPFIRNSGCNIVLGTDSLASNWSLNILDEMRTIQENFKEIPLEELLGWATINGAKALQMEDKIGSFEKGKRPGVVLIEELENGKISKHTRVRKIL